MTSSRLVKRWRWVEGDDEDDEDEDDDDRRRCILCRAFVIASSRAIENGVTSSFHPI